jgi:hypothetical protein
LEHEVGFNCKNKKLSLLLIKVLGGKSHHFPQKNHDEDTQKFAIIIKKHINEKNPSKSNQIIRGLKILKPQ